MALKKGTKGCEPIRKTQGIRKLRAPKCDLRTYRVAIQSVLPEQAHVDRDEFKRFLELLVQRSLMTERNAHTTLHNANPFFDSSVPLQLTNGKILDGQHTVDLRHDLVAKLETIRAFERETSDRSKGWVSHALGKIHLYQLYKLGMWQPEPLDPAEEVSRKDPSHEQSASEGSHGSASAVRSPLPSLGHSSPDECASESEQEKDAEAAQTHEGGASELVSLDDAVSELQRVFKRAAMRQNFLSQVSKRQTDSHGRLFCNVCRMRFYYTGSYCQRKAFTSDFMELYPCNTTANANPNGAVDASGLQLLCPTCLREAAPWSGGSAPTILERKACASGL